MARFRLLPGSSAFGRRFDTTVLRAVSVLAIINSHMDALYPRRWMGDGGQIGNMGFFIASGLGLALSQRTLTDRFAPWYVHRLSRIYPAVWLILGVMYLIIESTWRTWTPVDYVSHLIWPMDEYHFLGKIVVFYVPLYYYIRWSHPYKWLVLPLLALVVIGVSVPDMIRLHGGDRLVIGALSIPHKWALGLFVCILGAWIGQTADPAQWRLGRDALVLAGLFGVYFVLKFGMIVGGILPEAFLVQIAIAVLMVVYLTRCTTNPQFLHAVGQLKWPKLLLVLIGTISLEVYLVHMPMVRWPVWKEIGFPANVPLFFVCALVAAWIAHWAARWITSLWPLRKAGQPSEKESTSATSSTRP